MRYDPWPLFLAQAMVELPHHACLLSLLPFLTEFYKKEWHRLAQNLPGNVPFCVVDYFACSFSAWLA
jgi:hypothetical protein